MRADGKLRNVNKDVVILSYTATQDTTCAGKKMPPKVFSRSVYVQQQGKRVQTQYQETPID